MFKASEIPAVKAEVSVISVGTIASALRQLVPDYERISPFAIRVTYGNPAFTVDCLRQGAKPDVVIVSRSVLDDVLGLGVIDENSETTLATTAFGVGVKSAAERPDISTGNAFRKTLEKVMSIALVDRSPVTAALFKGLEKYGDTSSIMRKVKTYTTGELVAEAIAHDKVELGITTISELLTVQGVSTVGTVPLEIMANKAVTVAAVTRFSRNPGAAMDFVGFLRSPAARAVFSSKGHDPG